MREVSKRGETERDNRGGGGGGEGGDTERDKNDRK